MVKYTCDWCQILKQPAESWILGFAAENLGVTASRREVTILNEWERERAVHPFAVHFCCVEHKNNYMAALFDTTPADEKKVRKAGLEEIEVRRAVPGKRVVTTTAKRKRSSTRSRAS